MEPKDRMRAVGSHRVSQADHLPADDEGVALSYFRALQERFGQAVRGAGCVERHVDINGVAIRLRFAGPALVPVMLPALVSSSTSRRRGPGIRIDLWDSASAGVATPPAPWLPTEVLARGEVRHLTGERIRTVVDQSYHGVTVWDRATRRAVFWTADARRVAWYERAAPLRVILHWGLAGPGSHCLHAGAVGDEDGGVLLAGPAGSGKSTTALACLEAGMGYAGDDYVLVDLEPRPTAFRLYDTAKVDAPSFALLPQLTRAPAIADVAWASEAGRADGAKVVLDVKRYAPDALRERIPLTAVVLPQLSEGPTIVQRVGAARALRALAPSTILQHARESAGGLALMAALVRRVPCYALELGSDIAAVPAAIRSVLEDVR